MVQNSSIENIVTKLTSAGYFNEGSVILLMQDYYSDSRELDPNWVYYLARDLQVQAGESFIHPQKLYEAISDPFIKEKTNPPLMFHENYFRIADLNQKSEPIMSVPEEILSVGNYLLEVVLYLANEMGYNALVQHDKLHVASIVAGFASDKGYNFDPDDPKNIKAEKIRSDLPLMNFDLLEQKLKPVMPSEETIRRTKNYIEGVYRMADEYVRIGKSIVRESPEFSEESLEYLFFALTRLANSESTERIQNSRSYQNFMNNNPSLMQGADKVQQEYNSLDDLSKNFSY